MTSRSAKVEVDAASAILDYVRMCNAVGPLDFAGFAGGYRDYDAFLRSGRGTEEQRGRLAMIAEEARRRDGAYLPR